MNINQLLRQELYLQRVATSLINKGLFKSLDDAVAAVRLIMLDAETIQSPTKLNAVNRAIKQAIDEAMTPAWQQYTDELLELAVFDAEFYAELSGLPVVPGAQQIDDFVQSALMSLSAGQVPKVGTWSDFVRENISGMTEQINNLVKAGYINGATVNQIARTVRQFGDGLSRQQAEALARTGMQHYSQSARRAMVNDNLDIVNKEYPLVTFDNRTSKRCISINVQYPDGWPVNESPVGYPPYHFNAVGKGELITTATGQKKIENVVAGEYVLTHKGRFKKVLATMSKRNETDFIRVIRLKSGRVFRVTDEHPILLDDIGWVRADQIKVGDYLFEHRKQNAETLSGLPVVIRNPYNYPSAFDGSEVFSQVTISSIVMTHAVNFYPDIVTINGEVKYAIGETVLVSESLKSYCIENGNEVGLSLPHRLSLPCNLPLHEGVVPFSSAQRVCFGHSFGVGCVNCAGLLCHSESPVILSDSNTSFDFINSCNTAAFGSRHWSNSVNSTPSTHATIGKIKLSLYHSEGFSPCEMVSVDEAGEVGFISKFKHSLIPSVVESISIVGYKEDVYNLEVEDDHSYLIAGVVAHNCRTQIVYGLKGMGDPRKGIDRAATGSGPEYERGDTYKGKKDIGAFEIEQVPADMSFGAWLKMQDREFVIDSLGATRAKLFLDGKLPLDRMSDAYGRELTLAELRAKYADAFKRAGL